MNNRVKEIFIGPERPGPMTSTPTARALAGKGQEDDRYANGTLLKACIPDALPQETSAQQRRLIHFDALATYMQNRKRRSTRKYINWI